MDKLPPSEAAAAGSAGGACYRSYQQATKVEARGIPNVAAEAAPALVAVCMVNPGPDTVLGRLFSTHPAIESRIARLAVMR